MDKRAGEHEIEEHEKKAAAGTPDAKKRRGGSPSTTDGASPSGPGGAAAGLCDDVVGNILARVPTRTAVASMALSTRHRRLIRSPEFRRLHLRLAPPLPHPHIAYLATAAVRTRPVGEEEVPVRLSAFQGFHVAGAGGFNGNAPAPVRALAGRRFADVEYVNTCNGVVLLAAGGDKYSARSRCVLWNPAITDVVEEVSVPADASTSTRVKEYRTLGLGYGQRSEIYKLILLRRGRKKGAEIFSLVIYALADRGKKPAEIELPAVRGYTKFSQHSLYMDGKIYLGLNYHSKTSPATILALDVDDETVTPIDLPIAHDPDSYMSGLMELSGRPCVATYYDGDGCALWMLSVDHRWNRRCLIDGLRSEARIFPDSIIGVWDCGGVLVLCYKDELDDPDRLFVYDLTTGKLFIANLDSIVTLGSLGLAICWGYRPTLEAPSSVVGKLQQDVARECSTYIMKAVKPVAEQDRRKGQKSTLNTVCFMDFLARIMHKLPEDMQQVLEMKMMDSDDPDFTFENVFFSLD